MYNRYTHTGAKQGAGWMQKMGWEAFIVPIPPQFVQVFEDALPTYANDWLDLHGIERIVAPYSDRVKLGVMSSVWVTSAFFP